MDALVIGYLCGRRLLMRYFPAKIGLFGLVLMLDACATGNAGGNDSGIFPDNYREIVQDYLHTNLKDPYSVRGLSIGAPQQASVWTGLLNSGELDGWASCVTYNAKNSFGGYVGLRSYRMFIKSGSIEWVQQADCT